MYNKAFIVSTLLLVNISLFKVSVVGGTLCSIVLSFPRSCQVSRSPAECAEFGKICNVLMFVKGKNRYVFLLFGT